MKKRELGIDLLKALASLGVVSLHTLSPEKGPVNMVIATLSTLCIPLFFMVSGYLMLKRPKLDYRYALKKAATILAVCFCWEFLHAVAYFLYYQEMRSFLKSFVLDFFQQGLFYHFWYMGGLILLYLVMPLMDRLWKTSPKAYQNVLIGLAVLNTVLDLAAIVMGTQFVLNLPQNLRLHFWLFYAMLGGWIARNPDPAATVRNRIKPWTLAAALGAMVLFLRAAGTRVFAGTVIEAFYGSLPVQLAAFAVFLSALGRNCSTRTEKVVTVLSSLTMGIYIMHPFVLAVFHKFVPAFTQSGAVMNLLFWLATTVACGIITAVVQKIPVLNRLLKL